MRTTRTGAVVTAALSAGGARLAWSALNAAPPGGAGWWERKNHRGERLTLLEGPAYAVAAAAGSILAPGVPGRVRAAGALAALGAGGFGAVDDLAEAGARKGFRGHLGALARGEMTTGGLKVIGIGLTGLLAARLAADDGRADRRSLTGLLQWQADGALVAAAANVVNLLDLRPGRALKVVLLNAPLAAAAHPAAGLVAAACGPAVALLPEDLGERAMLGDTGANAAGALLGTALVARLTPRGRLGALAVLAALNLASERISFTTVIEATPGLREFDALGRRLR